MITVLPRLAAEALPGQKEAVFISITNPRQAKAALSDEWGSILRLGFHDVDENAGDFVTINSSQADELILFISENRDKPIFVHCEAGFSRSVAVGAFAAAWLRQEISVPIVNPNPGVLLALCRCGWRWAVRSGDWRLLKVSLAGPLVFLRKHIQ